MATEAMLTKKHFIIGNYVIFNYVPHTTNSL